jgi:hypothetical protein
MDFWLWRGAVLILILYEICFCWFFFLLIDIMVGGIVLFMLGFDLLKKTSNLLKVGCFF